MATKWMQWNWKWTAKNRTTGGQQMEAMEMDNKRAGQPAAATMANN